MNLKDCKILILDEQGPLFVYFGPDIRQIALTCPDDRQSLIFSSTPTPPSMPPIRMTEAAWSNRYHIRFGAASMLDTLATSKDLQQEGEVAEDNNVLMGDNVRLCKRADDAQVPYALRPDVGFFSDGAAAADKMPHQDKVGSGSVRWLCSCVVFSKCGAARGLFQRTRVGGRAMAAVAAAVGTDVNVGPSVPMARWFRLAALPINNAANTPAWGRGLHRHTTSVRHSGSVYP